MPGAFLGLPAWAKLAVILLPAGVAVAALVLVRHATAEGPVRELLPDLVQRAPYQLTGANVRTPRGTRFRLGFASAVENLGAGPLVIEGRRASAEARDMTADQLVERSDGARRRVSRVGALRYTHSTDHQHWHLLGFERYELRSADGSRARRDRKTGFCLGDRYEIEAVEFEAEPPGAVWTEECGRDQPALLKVAEGISVGFGDDYDPQLEGQYVDITGLPSGRYELVHEVNADRRLRESNYRNNAASILIDISWALGSPTPRVDVVQRCGDGRRCRPAR